MKVTRILVAASLAAFLSSCTVTVHPDGSKDVIVDSATVNHVAKIIAEK